MTTINSC